MRKPVVAVLGGGITGLVAARSLASSGCDVMVFESAERVGGQVRTIEFAGHPIDVGAEALHLAGPQVERLVEALGLGDDLVVSNPVRASIWTERGLRPLPGGVGPAGPTRLGPVISSRALSLTGLARAGIEPLVSRRRDGEDVGVGEELTRRFGRQVVDRLVDPVLGSLHAGDIDRLSLTSATPYVAARLAAHRSLIWPRPRATTGGLTFVSFVRGLVQLVDALAGTPGVAVHTGTVVERIVRERDRYSIRTREGPTSSVDGVLVALGAGAAATALADLAPVGAPALRGVRAASVATVVVAYPRRAAARAPGLRGSGILVPSSAHRLLKAATFLSSKWPHLEDPGRFLVRLSAGRVGDERIQAMDDDELVGHLDRELAEMTGLVERPVDALVVRWPNTLARLEVGHAERLRALRADLAAHSAVDVAGAAFDGLGIATCVAAGTRAAGRIALALDLDRTEAA